MKDEGRLKKRFALIIVYGFSALLPLKAELLSFVRSEQILFQGVIITKCKMMTPVVRGAFMFCPNCASQNPDQTKFCRNCGLDLKNIALALNNLGETHRGVNNSEKKRIELTEQWIELHSEGFKRIIQGSLLILTAVLFGAALGLFLKGDVQENWVLIWIIFCGWLPVWGAITLGEGISKMHQSWMIHHNMAKLSALLNPPANVETREFPQTADVHEGANAASVTEQTTSPLIKPHAQ
jgi:zinc-ribbon domain